MNESLNAKNIVFMGQGKTKRIGYKSLRGFIKILKSQNKKLRELNCRVRFTIDLPIKD